MSCVNWSEIVNEVAIKLATSRREAPRRLSYRDSELENIPSSPTFQSSVYLHICEAFFFVVVFWPSPSQYRRSGLETRSLSHTLWIITHMLLALTGPLMKTTLRSRGDEAGGQPRALYCKQTSAPGSGYTLHTQPCDVQPSVLLRINISRWWSGYKRTIWECFLDVVKYNQWLYCDI